MNTIIHGDCLEVMPTLPDHSIDMILCDLPYGTTACTWDIVIPFEPLWTQYKRLIKRNGAIVLFGSEPFSSLLRLNNLDWYKYDWVWKKDKSANFGVAKFRPLNITENILIFSNGTNCYNPQMWDSGYKSNKGGKNSIIGGVYGTNGFKWGYRDTTEKFPVNVIDCPTPKHNDLNGTLHPTQKPIALFSYLIRTYTNPGELVLDNCAGSGSTAIAAIETGRNWICIEKDTRYFEVASHRIEERLSQPFLIEPTKEEETKPIQDSLL